MRGTYSGETEDGCAFEIFVNSGQRRASGNELMQAKIRSMTQGRPTSNSDLYVQHDEIYILVGNHHRKDIRINPNGSYSYGNIHGQTFKDIVVNMIEAFGSIPERGALSAAPKGPRP